MRSSRGKDSWKGIGSWCGGVGQTGALDGAVRLGCVEGIVVKQSPAEGEGGGQADTCGETKLLGCFL